MGDARVQERIDGWLAAGLIDAATAGRLHEAEAAEHGPAAALLVPAAPVLQPPVLPAPAPSRGVGAVAAAFGPGVSIAEMFGYLGAIFLIGALSAFFARIAGTADDPALVGAFGAAIEAAVLAGVGFVLRTGDGRRRRAAGVAFVVAVIDVGASAAFFGQVAGLEWPVLGIVASALAVAAAVAFRVAHPAVLTQLALLGAMTGLAGSLLVWIQQVVLPPVSGPEVGVFQAISGPEQVTLVVGSAVWWLGFAVLIGLLGLRESSSVERDPTAGRRAAASRIWAGFVAVLGLASAVAQSGPTGNAEYARFLEPWIGDLALIALSAVLVERAFRREASAYIYPAALGLIIALSDFNVAYLSNSTELALLIEGLILIGVGLAADRLRRRIGGQRGTPTPMAGPPSDGEAVPGDTSAQLEPASGGVSGGAHAG